MEAGERGVLVGDVGGRAVAGRIRLDRVEEVRVDEAWRSDREEREEREADQPGDEDRIPEDDIVVVMAYVQVHARRGEHRPEAPDVESVRRLQNQRVPEQGGLEHLLPIEVERLLERRSRRPFVAACSALPSVIALTMA